MRTNQKLPPFRGVATALITPFLHGKIDLARFREQIRFQLRGGVDGLVVCGTTGEAPTLRPYERDSLQNAAREESAGAIPVIMGIGSNDTQSAVSAAKRAEKLGADALLAVTPYYNKGTKNGIVAHYLKIAEATGLPLILYNVPGRTGVDLDIGQLVALAEHPNICALKDAGGNIEKTADICAALGECLPLYSGNDSQIVPILSLGGVGVISVLSNLLPELTCRICNLWFAGKVKESAALQLRLLPLIRLLFADVNPAPVKAAMEIAGYDSGELRLPLSDINEELKRKLYNMMKIPEN